MCERREACVEFESRCGGCRQLLLGFEEDRVCVVREVQRQGCIGGSRPWTAAERRVWPGERGKAGLVEGYGIEGQRECAEEGRPEDCA